MASGAPAGATLYLVLIQLASRALTFGGNQFLLRFLSPELLGRAVQLELLSVSVLYFSRESLRVALQKHPKAPEAQHGGKAGPEKPDGHKTQVIVNLSYIAVVLGILLTLFWNYVYSQTASANVTDSPHFIASLWLYGIATVVELLSEPSFVIIQQRQLYKSRARSETTAAILKCISACFTASLIHQRGSKASVLPFAVGQLAYAVTLLALYLETTYPLSHYGKEFSLLLRRLPPLPNENPAYILQRFSQPLLSLSATLYAQSIFKQLLTQGDTYILASLASLSDQGAFALASNYGGLLARIVFQPIEESSRNTFGALLSSSSTTATTINKAKPGQPAIKSALTHLTNILHFYFLLTLITLSLAPHLLPTLVSLLAGSRWFTPQISALLSAYAYYIPLMAFNGILDAFVTSVATPHQLNQQSIAMAVCTVTYGVAAYVCLGVLGMGARGLVVANAVGMGCRVGWSAVFVRRWESENLEGNELDRKGVWQGLIPSAGSITAGAVIAVALRTGLNSSKGADARKIGGVDVTELGKMIGAGVFLGSSILFFERKYLIQTVSQILPERLAQKVDISGPVPSTSKDVDKSD